MGTEMRREEISKFTRVAEVLVCVALAATRMSVGSPLAKGVEPVPPADGLELRSDRISAEEYAILHSCVNDLIVRSLIKENPANGPESLTIFPYTIQWPRDAQTVLMSGTAIPSRERDSMVASFLKNNRSSCLLDGVKLRTTIGRGVPNTEQIGRMMKHGNGSLDKRAFDAVFPKARAILQVSRAGINENGDKAILYVSHIDRSRPGAGWLGMFLLEKRQSQWCVVRQIDGLQE